MSFTKPVIKPPIIAHRGLSAAYPENTLLAFRKAKEAGLNWVEFDVMLSADEELIVIHDETLQRTTNGVGSVNDYSYAQLKEFDAGSWFSPKFKSERIPTLQEVVELLNQLRLCANIEIKAQAGYEALTVRNVLHTLKTHWNSTTSQPLISSFSVEILQQVRKQSATSLVGFLMHEWRDDWQRVADDLQAVTVNVNCDVLTAARVDGIKATNRLVLSYTVNNKEKASQLYGWGVDAVFSDCPSEMLQLLVT